ncbi:MAG: helix-turn-helix transcriptional regulator, partial [Paludibacteraceae bacterium]|nr:helix-turn-helix transcriptional regulator [Paludibacteraceae bacterium]
TRFWKTSMVSREFRYLWYNYKSEVGFGLVLLPVLIASTFLSRLIPADFFDSFLNPALSLAFAVLCFFGAAQCLRHLENNRIRKVWAVILLLWGLQESVVVVMFKAAYNPFRVGNELMESTPMLAACVFAWLLFIYPCISMRPGKFNWSRAALFLLPVVVLGVIDYVLPADLRILIALYPVWLIYVGFRRVHRYRQWCEENFSSLDDIDAQWIVRYIMMIILAGLVFFYLCVSDDPARAFTQQWYLMFVLGYTTDQVLHRPDPWERLRSTAVAEEKEEEPDPANAAYRTALDAWVEKDKPYLNPDFQLTDLRQVLPLNRSYLSRFINSAYGCSFYHWANGLRIKEAKRLMIEQPELKIQDLADRCGFSSRQVFARVFARETGFTPSEWISSSGQTPIEE